MIILKKFKNHEDKKKKILGIIRLFKVNLKFISKYLSLIINK